MQVNAHAFRVLISPGKVASIQHTYTFFWYSIEREIRCDFVGPATPHDSEHGPTIATLTHNITRLK
jgi:hypothetical protein